MCLLQSNKKARVVVVGRHKDTVARSEGLKSGDGESPSGFTVVKGKQRFEGVDGVLKEEERFLGGPSFFIWLSFKLKCASLSPTPHVSIA
jgi:hypothetical protein